MKRRRVLVRHDAEQRSREAAIHLLALCASGRGETLRDIAEHYTDARPHEVQIARRALTLSIADGLRWREARAEAEARLRCGERVR